MARRRLGSTDDPAASHLLETMCRSRTSRPNSPRSRPVVAGHESYFRNPPRHDGPSIKPDAGGIEVWRLGGRPVIGGHAPIHADSRPAIRRCVLRAGRKLRCGRPRTCDHPVFQPINGDSIHTKPRLPTELGVGSLRVQFPRRCSTIAGVDPFDVRTRANRLSESTPQSLVEPRRGRSFAIHLLQALPLAGGARRRRRMRSLVSTGDDRTTSCFVDNPMVPHDPARGCRPVPNLGSHIARNRVDASRGSRNRTEVAVGHLACARHESRRRDRVRYTRGSLAGRSSWIRRRLRPTWMSSTCLPPSSKRSCGPRT